MALVLVANIAFVHLSHFAGQVTAYTAKGTIRCALATCVHALTLRYVTVTLNGVS